MGAVCGRIGRFTSKRSLCRLGPVFLERSKSVYHALNVLALLPHVLYRRQICSALQGARDALEISHDAC